MIDRPCASVSALAWMRHSKPLWRDCLPKAGCSLQISAMQTAISTNIVPLRINFSIRKNGHYDASSYLSERASPYRLGHGYFGGHRHPPLLHLLRSHSKE